MKKQVKIISTILIVLMLVASLSTIVFAAPDLSGKIDEIGQGNNAANTDKVVSLGKTIVTIMQTVGIVVAVVVLLILGIKYMMGSAEEKAEYKKTLIPYLIGCIMIFAITEIVSIIYNLVSQVEV